MIKTSFLASRTLRVANTVKVQTQPLQLSTKKSQLDLVKMSTSIKSLTTKSIKLPNLFNRDVKLTQIVNRVMQSIRPDVFTTSLAPSYVLSTDKLPINQRQNNEIKQTLKKFSAVESEIGISSEKPQVILLSSFVPLYRQDQGNTTVTAAGKLLDIYSQVQQLKQENIASVLRDASNAVDTMALRDKFLNSVVDLRTAVGSVLTTVKKINELKEKFDLRHSTYDVDVAKVSNLHIANFIGASRTSYTDRAKELDGIIKNYDIGDVLVSFGFDKTNVTNVFSSTKMWMQLLIELKYLLSKHSLHLLSLSKNQYFVDASSCRLTVPWQERVSLNPGVNIFDVRALVSSNASQLSQTLYSLTQAFASLYLGTKPVDLKQKVSLQATLLSRELKYSEVLSQPVVNSLLQEQYQYKVNDVGNIAMFDNVIGKFGNDIADVPLNIDKSLSNLSLTVADKAILNFEEKYVNGDNGTLIPGSVYFCDSILDSESIDFDTKNLETFIDRLDSSFKNFNSFTAKFNLLSFEDESSFMPSISNARKLFDDLAKQLIDVSTGVVRQTVAVDKLGSLFQFTATSASSASRLKSLLFIIAMCKMEKVSGQTNSQLIDACINEINSIVSNGVTNTLIPPQSRLMSVTQAEISQLLRSDVGLMGMLLSFLAKVKDAFYRDNRTVFEGKTRYTGVNDTVVLSLALDLFVNTVGLFCNQTFGAKHVGQGSSEKNNVSYVIYRVNTNMAQTLSAVEYRIDNESVLIKQAIYSIFNTLQGLRDSAVDVVNTLNSKENVAQRASIASVIGEDKLRVLYTEQQAQLVNSMVSDLMMKLQKASKTIRSQGQDLQIFDENMLLSRTKQALLGWAKDPAFSTDKAFNKKLISVGVPVGFVENIRQTINVNGASSYSFKDYQNDIINVCVFKTDMRYQDIIFKPQKFLFELSRFVVTVDDMLPEFTNFDDFVSKVMMRDFASTFNSKLLEVQSLVSTDAQALAFNDVSYSFLSDSQKRKIVENHVISFLLESYIFALSGLSVSERCFEMELHTESMIANDLARALVDLNLKKTLESTKKIDLLQKLKPLFFASITPRVEKSVATSVLKPTSASLTMRAPAVKKKQSTIRLPFINEEAVLKSVSTNPYKAPVKTEQKIPQNPASQPVSSPTLSEQQIKNFPPRAMKKALNQLTTIDDFSKMLSTYSDGLAVSRKMLTPKLFDRVLHVIVDPDDFVVDQDKTLRTPQGRELLNQLIGVNELIRVGDEVRSRDKGAGDSSFDKYFVTIELEEGKK